MTDNCLLRNVRRSNSCSGLSEDEFAELRAIADLYLDAFGLLLKLAEMAAKMAESALRKFPETLKKNFEELVYLALEQAYDAAFWTNRAGRKNSSWLDKVFNWANGETWHSIAATIAGAFGGSGGVTTTVVELPVTTTLILRSIQEIARNVVWNSCIREVAGSRVTLFWGSRRRLCQLYLHQFLPKNGPRSLSPSFS